MSFIFYTDNPFTQPDRYHMIDTNLIIGSLGSGKTSCIQHLIEQIPDNEYWLIIVNEFGQIGIDAALLSEQQSNNLNIREISGGCICCAAQSKLRVNLTQLIRDKRPDRILIEATGLGHPAGIIDLLRDEYLKPVINISTIITVVDISLFDQQPDSHDTGSPINTENFKQQIQLADIIVLNKMDLATNSNQTHVRHFLKSFYPLKNKIIETMQGKIDSCHLSFDSAVDKKVPFSKVHTHYDHENQTFQLHDFSIQQFSSESESHMSFGFIFPAEVTFSRKCLQNFFTTLLNNPSLQIERLKAVFNCGRNWYGFNAVGTDLNISESFYRRDSRIEIISAKKNFDITDFRNRLFVEIKSAS